MVTRDTSESLVPSPSVIDVREHHHKVRLAKPINFIHNMSVFERMKTKVAQICRHHASPIQGFPSGAKTCVWVKGYQTIFKKINCPLLSREIKRKL